MSAPVPESAEVFRARLKKIADDGHREQLIRTYFYGRLDQALLEGGRALCVAESEFRAKIGEQTGVTEFRVIFNALVAEKRTAGAA